MKDFWKKLSQLFISSSLIFIVALLGSIGGQGYKELRRFVLPAIVTIYAYFLLHNIWVLTIYSMAGALSIGYGIPDATDEGAAIGRFFYKLFHNSALWANVFTRGIVGKLISLSMLSVPFVTGHWVSFGIGSWIIIGIWGSVSWRGFGSIPVKIFGKVYTLLNVDLTVYAVTACGIVLIINGWLR